MQSSGCRWWLRGFISPWHPPGFMSGSSCLWSPTFGKLVENWEKPKECRVFHRTRRVSASGKTRQCWKNILVMSVIALDSSFVPVGHQLHQWIPSFKYWTFSRPFAFMCKRTRTVQWGIPMKYNGWVWLLVWINLTPRLVFDKIYFTQEA